MAKQQKHVREATKVLARLGYYPADRQTGHKAIIFKHKTAEPIQVFCSPATKSGTVTAVLREAQQKLLRDRANRDRVIRK